jgi:hypothetical protein
LNALFFAGVVVFLAACTVIRTSVPLVKIGLVAPFEGRYRYVGYDAINGARLAVREANAADHTSGYELQLAAYDDGGTIAGARVAARNLERDPQVVAVIGHFLRDTTLEAMMYYERFGLPLLMAGTVEGWVDSQHQLVCSLLDLVSAKLADEAGAKKSGQIQWMSQGSGLPACASSAMVIVSWQLPPPPNVSAVIMDLEPVKAGESLRVLRDVGWEGIIAGGPALGSPLFAQIADPQNVIFASPYRWPESGGQDGDFSARYQSLGPHVPQPGPFGLNAYQTVQSVIFAVEVTGGSDVKVNRDVLARYLNNSLAPETLTLYFYQWASPAALKLIGKKTLSQPSDDEGASLLNDQGEQWLVSADAVQIFRLPKIDALVTRR